jgi:tyrosine-protein phosphatase OCA1
VGVCSLNFLEDQGISFVHCGLDESRLSSWNQISEETVLEALSYILDGSNYPLHVMDHLGRHRTGTALGCLRKVQHVSVVVSLALLAREG